MKYFLAERELQINGFLVIVYFSQHAHGQLTFDEHRATIATKEVLDNLLIASYGVEGWTYVRVIQQDSGVL